jgi:hypothetical protein
MLCHGCGKDISGRYIEALGHQWHEDHFRCTVCREQFGGGKFLEHDGKPYCERDYYEKFGLRCHGCGQPIRGEYIKAIGQIWHREHFVCAVCRRPFPDDKFVEKNGQAYCQHDYYETFGTRCCICNKAMDGEYLTNFWNDSFCKRHKQELDECFGCNRLICASLTGGGVQYQDGRKICNICRKTAIDEVLEAKELFVEVRRVIARHGVTLDNNADVPLRLGSLDEIDKLAGGTPATEAGITLTQVTTLGGSETGRTIKEVVILYGLPRENAMQVIAHEFGHVWCFYNRMPELVLETSEGLCELFAYLCLSESRTPESRYYMRVISENEDAVYGNGFRRAREALGSKTLAQLLEQVRNAGRL